MGKTNEKTKTLVREVTQEQMGEIVNELVGRMGMAERMLMMASQATMPKLIGILSGMAELIKSIPDSEGCPVTSEEAADSLDKIIEEASSMTKAFGMTAELMFSSEAVAALISERTTEHKFGADFEQAIPKSAVIH
jgi:hypothetical protein